MPTDNSAVGSKSASKSEKNEKARRLTSLAEDIYTGDDAPFRQRLHLLFSQIEKEFELLYMENLSCKCMNISSEF